MMVPPLGTEAGTGTLDKGIKRLAAALTLILLSGAPVPSHPWGVPSHPLIRRNSRYDVLVSRKLDFSSFTAASYSDTVPIAQVSGLQKKVASSRAELAHLLSADAISLDYLNSSDDERTVPSMVQLRGARDSSSLLLLLKQCRDGRLRR